MCPPYEALQLSVLMIASTARLIILYGDEKKGKMGLKTVQVIGGWGRDGSWEFIPVFDDPHREGQFSPPAVALIFGYLLKMAS